MAKAKGQNIIFIGKDGKVVIASGAGRVAVGRAETVLTSEVIELMRKRQAAGKELANVLAKARFDVTGSQEMTVVDPSGALAKLGRRKKKS